MIIFKVLKCYLHFIALNIKTFANPWDKIADHLFSDLLITILQAIAYPLVRISKVYHINIFLGLVKNLLQRPPYSLLNNLRIDNAGCWVLISSGGIRKINPSLVKKS